MNSSRIVAVMALLLILRARTTLGQNTPPSSAQNPTQSASAPVEVYVFGEQPVSTATEQTVRQKDLELRPTATPVDILTSSVPVYTPCSIKEAAKPTSISLEDSMPIMERISRFSWTAFR
jgi:hypothetical protein